MRRGRGAAGGGGQEFVFEEEEPGEERQRQDEAAEGQCGIGAKVVDDGKKKRVETGGLRFWCELGFCFPAASGDKNSVTDASSRRSGDEIN